MKMRIIYSLIVVCIMLVPYVASAQDAATVQLEQRIRALEQANISRGANVAGAVSRAEAIQTEFGTLKGAVDSNAHLIQGLNSQMQGLFQDLSRRIQVLEDKIRMIDDMIKRGAGIPKPTEEYMAHQAAAEKMGGGDYLGAAADFQQFVQNFPRSKMTASVQYNIGECYFFAHDYQQAIKQLQVFIERNPRNEKIADAMVMQGSAFVHLSMLDEARAFFTKVVRDFSGTGAARQAEVKLQMLQSGAAMTAQNNVSQPKGIDVGYPSETIEQQRARERAAIQQKTEPAPSRPVQTPAAPPAGNKRKYMEF